MSAPDIYDVAIAGGGPAGATCAALCAAAGLRTVVIEKSRFPRDKVCGDCVNPGCWPVLDQLGIAQEVLAASHHSIRHVTFVSEAGRRIEIPLPANDREEIAISRRILDDILLRRAEAAGAEILHATPLHKLERDTTGHWRIHAGDRAIVARRLVAADGRNSTVARLLGTAPAARRDRIGMQAHVAIPHHANSATPAGIELHILPAGYCGTAPIGDGLTNVCMVATPASMDELKAAICRRFAISTAHQWRTIAPLARAPIGPLIDGVVYLGDAARVVEPFTGEGIYYALQTASLAATHIIADSLHLYPAAHAALYHRRLWINRLARLAVTRPAIGASLLHTLGRFPRPLQFLVSRVSATRHQPVTEFQESNQPKNPSNQ